MDSVIRVLTTRYKCLTTSTFRGFPLLHGERRQSFSSNVLSLPQRFAVRWQTPRSRGMPESIRNIRDRHSDRQEIPLQEQEFRNNRRELQRLWCKRFYVITLGWNFQNKINTSQLDPRPPIQPLSFNFSRIYGSKDFVKLCFWQTRICSSDSLCNYNTHTVARDTNMHVI